MAVLTGKRAPLFSAPAVINGGEIIEEFSLEQYLGQKYVIFFFYPADFTFVCPTEILAFQKRMADFEKRNVAVVGCSTDSQFSHWKWLNTPVKEGGIEGVKYPLRPFKNFLHRYWSIPRVLFDHIVDQPYEILRYLLDQFIWKLRFIIFNLMNDSTRG